MSGLPSGQFVDYLIIGLLVTVAAGLVFEVVRRKITSHWGRIAFALVLATAGVIGRFKFILQPRTELPSNQAGGQTTGEGSTRLPRASPDDSSSPVTSSMQPKETQPKETSEAVFVRENIAAPSKGSRKTGQWAVIILEPGTKDSYPKLATTAASMIAEAGHSTVAIFRPFATRGAAFDSLFAADPALSRRLNEYCDEILLGKITSSVKENPDYPGLRSLTLTVDVKTISTKTGDVQHQFQASAVGAGYDIGEARTNAEESLAANLRSELHNVIK
jgi:hypothetical protein